MPAPAHSAMFWGEQLAEGGAQIQTIMAILGHRSAQMSATHSHISDPVLKEQYEKVIAAGGRIAGPAVEEVLTSRIGEDTLNWLKAELELGHCLWAPAEGACACDLYLRCSKFLTTSEYHHACGPGSPVNSSSPRTPSNAAGPAKSNGTTPSPNGSAASSLTLERAPTLATQTTTADQPAHNRSHGIRRPGSHGRCLHHRWRLQHGRHAARARPCCSGSTSASWTDRPAAVCATSPGPIFRTLDRPTRRPSIWPMKG